MRNPAATVSATQHQSTQAGNHSQGWAIQFLQLLGKDPRQTYFRTIRPGKGANGNRKGRDLQGLDLEALSRDSHAGESVYFVSGDSTAASGKAVRDDDVTACRALFAEWDDRPMQWQLEAWRELGLPEPSAMVLTGGKSVHCYWVLSEPMAPGQWRELQSRLIDHCGSDQQCKNPSRVMRLPGFAYIDKTTSKPNGNIAELVHTSTARYGAAEIEACLPSLLSPPAAAPAPAPARGLPHRTLQEIEAAAAYIPVRVEGGNTYEDCRRALCGCAAALAEIGLPEEQALDLLASKWPDRATAQQVLESSSTRNPATFWAIAREGGYQLSSKTTASKVVPLRGAPAPSARFSPRPDSTANWGQRRMSHSKAMQCLDRCIEVQAQRERNSLRRRARLLKAAKDLGLAAYVNRQEIAQKVLEAKARCSGEGFKPLTAADRAAMPKPVVRWLVKGLIPAHDMTIIGGRPKVGKTRLAVAIVAAVLRGEPFLDFQMASATPPVLLVTDDQSAGDTADMLTAMDLWNHPRLITSEHFRLTESELEKLLEAIKANPGALVVLDSLRSIGRALQTGENDPEIGATLYDLKQSVTDAGGTLLLIHHCNKAADLVGVEALSGHNAIGGAANTVITLHHCPNDKGLPDKINPQRRLFSEGRSGGGCDVVIDRAGRGAYRLVSTFEHWQQQLADAKKANKLERLTELQQQALDALNDSGEWMTRRQVCEALELPWGDRGQSREAKNLAKSLTRLLELEAIESANAGRETTFRSCETQKEWGSSRSTSNGKGSGDSEDWGSTGDLGGSRGSSPTTPQPLIPLIPLDPHRGDQRNPLPQLVDPLDPLDPTRNSPPAPANWPTWGDALLQIRADHPDHLPAQLANLLQARAGIRTDGQTIKGHLKAWDSMEVA
jgi:hypothetical protein